MPLRPTGPGGLGGASSLLRTSLSSSARVAAPTRMAVERPTLSRVHQTSAAQLSLFGRTAAAR